MDSRSKVSCFDKAVELLGRRPYFRAQLEVKLLQRGFPEEQVAAALERLDDLGYLDDRRTAAELVAARLARAPEGRRRLAAELGRRGAPPEVISEVLAERREEDDLTLARQAARAWRRRGGSDPRALARHLDRKGFSQGAVLRLLDESGEEPEEPA